MKCLQCGIENDDGAKFCSSCGADLKINVKSFKQHLFNWKYYIFPILLGVFVGAGTYAFDSLGYSTTDNKVPMLIWISIILQTKNFKASFGKKLLMFFASFLSMAFVMGIAISATISIYKIVDYNKEKSIYLNSALQQNQKLPIMLNEYIQYVKNTTNEQDIILHMKFVNYTKNEILEDYTNVNEFEKELLQDELETSCLKESVKKILQTGIVMRMEYSDKNDELVDQIYINDEGCKPYYK
jgi:hypothetical protein